MFSPFNTSWAQQVLNSIGLLWRIPIIIVIVFGACCGSVISVVFVFRVSAWIFTRFLANPW